MDPVHVGNYAPLSRCSLFLRLSARTCPPSPSPPLPRACTCNAHTASLTSARSTLVGYNISSGLAEPSYCFPLLRGSASLPLRPTLRFQPYSRVSFASRFHPRARVLSYNLITRKAARTGAARAAFQRYILDFPSLETFCAEKLYLGEKAKTERTGGRFWLVASGPADLARTPVKSLDSLVRRGTQNRGTKFPRGRDASRGSMAYELRGRFEGHLAHNRVD